MAETDELEGDVHKMVMDVVYGLWEAFMAEANAKSTTHKPTHESPTVQVVDINANATSYAGASGLRDDHPTIDTNFHPLVVEPTFEGVNISIPRKVVEKVSSRLEHTLYGYFMGKRTTFSVVEYYNWAKHGLKKV